MEVSFRVETCADMRGAVLERQRWFTSLVHIQWQESGSRAPALRKRRMLAGRQGARVRTAERSGGVEDCEGGPTRKNG